MRIAIVNDLLLAVEALRRVILSVPEYEVAWVAFDGKEAVDKCAFDLPDLILMDILMPVMDGVQATCVIMSETPCAILVVTSTVTGNASRVFEAMGCGALDAACTPVFRGSGEIEGSEELLRKIATVKKLIGKGEPKNGAPISPVHEPQSFPLVAIGSSTGGPRAVAAILSRFPRGFETAVIIVQHVDERFAEGFADWLREGSPLPVFVAREGMFPEPGSAYVAATNDHLVLGGDHAFHYTSEPVNNPYRPLCGYIFLQSGA